MTKPQHQGSLTEQLEFLIKLANENGLYDAADFVRNTLANAEMRRKQYAVMRGEVPLKGDPAYFSQVRWPDGDDAPLLLGKKK